MASYRCFYGVVVISLCLLKVDGVYARDMYVKNIDTPVDIIEREGALNLASGVSNPHNLTGTQSVHRPALQNSVMTGDTVMGIAANKNEALRHFEQAHANTATGKNTYDRRSGHVRYRPYDGSAVTAELMAEQPDREDPLTKRYAYEHNQLSVTHLLFAFLIAGIVVATGLRIFHNYTKANDWVATMTAHGGSVDVMDKSNWRIFVKSLGA
eukprot:CAMPEP_0198202788 /NCGR_PEP_ID=MMETSP1445-20131203/5997_1 /TAXON_ID=36898 /ORGANISM="Pyramimonas sp., Strain CCMP2087" /LENGTH=210 /DNA_ID=CAMNT_0043873881 /DNA_START=137 /DNA_END=769 /DNA_ORIENTATION=+